MAVEPPSRIILVVSPGLSIKLQPPPGTLSVLYLVAFVVWKGAAWGAHVAWRAESYARADAAALSGVLALSFYIHNIIITVMGNNARQENNVSSKSEPSRAK